MELIKKEAAWFASDAGCQAYRALHTLEERSIFLYSYLKTIAHESFDRDGILFKFAFLLADGVSRAEVTYSAYPEIIRENANPFIAYLRNADVCFGEKETYIALMAILHGLADPRSKTAWIYDKSILGSKDYDDALEEHNAQFLPAFELEYIDLTPYSVDKALEFIQLELVWLFAHG